MSKPGVFGAKLRIKAPLGVALASSRWENLKIVLPMISKVRSGEAWLSKSRNLPTLIGATAGRQFNRE
jgi:hypothetical protein